MLRRLPELRPRPDPDLHSVSPSSCIQASALCSSQSTSGCSSWGEGGVVILYGHNLVVRCSHDAKKKQGLSKPPAEERKQKHKCTTFVFAPIFHELRMFPCIQKANFSAMSERSSFLGISVHAASPVRWMIVRAGEALTHRFRTRTRFREKQRFCARRKSLRFHLVGVKTSVAFMFLLSVCFLFCGFGWFFFVVVFLYQREKIIMYSKYFRIKGSSVGQTSIETLT